MVVATGGTLYRRLFEQNDLLEHREDPELPVELQYAPSHEVQVQEGGLLSQLIPGCNILGKLVTRARCTNVRTTAPRGGPLDGRARRSGQRS